VDTPARRQYLDLKAQHPDALLLYRMGDFYELFDDDAQVAARELRITLTSREFGKGQRVPMAGVPHHALQSYLRRLIARGFRVAICEQLSEPGKGLVERAVVRVVSPGTVAEPGLLIGNEHNYLAAILAGDEAIGLAYVDVSTGELQVAEFRGAEREAELAAELHRIGPSECLFPLGQEALALVGHRSALDPSQFDPLGGRETLCRQFGVRSLEGYGCAALPLAVGAAGAAVRFLDRTNPVLLSTLAPPRTYSPREFLLLDPSTRRNLELTRGSRTGALDQSLLAVIDRTRTPMGGRLLREMLGQPLRDLAQLEARLDAVEELIDDDLYRRAVARAFRSLGDLERTIGRTRQGQATARELGHLRDGLARLPELIEGLRNRDSALLQELQRQLDPCADVVTLIGRALAEEDSRVIQTGYSRELDVLGELVQSSRRWLTDFERDERQRTGIRSLKVSFNRVFGYFIEVTNPNLPSVPREYQRKQTLANGERFVTERLLEMANRVVSAEARLQELERELFAELLTEVGSHAQRLFAAARAVAQLDVLVGLADLAAERGYSRPLLSENGAWRIEGGRHPVVEARLGAQEFVANDCSFGPDEGVVRLVTGPNMAGKSTYLRQVALISLLAQVGSFVPARRAELPLVDRIFTRIGAQDDLAAGASTFLVEMAETANILRHATARSLVILDEVGRGTSTYDGLALARAILEDLHNRVGARTLFATHFHELTELTDQLSGVRNFHAAASEDGDQLTFLYRVVPGASARSYGIQAARLAGLAPPVLDRATELLSAYERDRDSSARLVDEPPLAEAAPETGALARPPGLERPTEPEREEVLNFGAAASAILGSSQRVAEGAPPWSPAERTLVAELLALDLAATTPLEALNALHRLQVAARRLADPE
jgi:DNA mismatch repair protein MutS